MLRNLANNVARVIDYVRSLPVDNLRTAHAPGEWTVQDILVHVIDSERVFAYRALRIGRGDDTHLPGFPHEEFVSSAQANQRSLDDILSEYRTVRQATLSLLNSLDETSLTNAALCNGQRTSLRALIYDMAGHELHHLYSIQENYG